MSACHESPTISACSLETATRSSAISKMAGSGFETPTASEATSASTNGARPQYLQLVLLLFEQIVGDDGNPRVRPQFGEERRRTIHRAPRDHVAIAVGAGDGIGHVLVDRQVKCREDTPEPLPPRLVQRHPAGQHFDVHLFEIMNVMALEIIERHTAGKPRVNGGQRRPGGTMMIEEGIVEIEQYGTAHH